MGHFCLIYGFWCRNQWNFLSSARTHSWTDSSHTTFKAIHEKLFLHVIHLIMNQEVCRLSKQMDWSNKHLSARRLLLILCLKDILTRTTSAWICSSSLINLLSIVRKIRKLGLGLTRDANKDFLGQGPLCVIRPTSRTLTRFCCPC